MSQRELIERIQRRCQRGESLRKIAEQEGLSVDAVRQLTSAPRFQKNLTMHHVNSSLAGLKPSPHRDRITGRALTKLLRLAKSGAAVPLSMADLVSLGAFSKQQQTLAVSSIMKGK